MSCLKITTYEPAGNTHEPPQASIVAIGVPEEYLPY
jgi:hypothetical protein